MKIVPDSRGGACRTGSLSSRLTPDEISAILGFTPNIDDDATKVRHSWGFQADGKLCGIWDYKGSRWSTYGPHDVFVKLFGPERVGND